MNPVIVVHYHEIALKRKNRDFFERKLVENIQKALKGLVEPKTVKREYGRIIIQINGFKQDKKPTKTDVKDERFAKEIVKRDRYFVANASPLAGRLKKVFGIAYFAFGLQTQPSVEDFCKVAKKLLREEKFTSFAVKTRRSNKIFPLSSQKINEKVGAFIKESLKKEVNLTNPNLTLYIEIALKKAFVYTQKIPGPGGLPVGTAGKVASLISAGLDSPVAAWYLMKRGAKVVFIHFCSFPCMPKNSKARVKKIIKTLNSWQFNSTLCLVHFGEVHNALLKNCPPSLLCVLCKRMMTRIAEMLARREKAKALVTGESLGQVASQTLPNIKAINKVATMPILRPLIGMDKEEIINKAREIGTYELSLSKPPAFQPKHVTTAAKIEEVEEAEKALNIPKLIKDTLAKVEKQKFSTLA